MPNDPILQILLKDEVLTQEQSDAAEAAQTSGQNIEEYLQTNNVASEEQITQAKGKLFNIPYVDLTGKTIEPDVLRLISEDTAKTYKVIAYQKSDTEVNVGVVDPRNFKALEAVEFLMKDYQLHPYYFIISESNFNSAVKSYSALGEEVSQVLDIAKERFDQSEQKTEEEDVTAGGDLQNVIKRAPVSKIVSIIIKHAADSRASDIHIEPAAETSKVRYRIDGILHESLVLPINLHAPVTARIKVLADMKLDETRKPQDGRIRMKFGKQQVDLRISTIPLVAHEKIVMRILDTSGKVPRLVDLGYNERTIQLIEESMRKTHGMVLVTGPTGSGKSTTLYSVLNILNDEKVNIVTLEDPAEFYMPGVNQSQVNPEVGFTFASGLRSILRQDPDIIMVGEIRDTETAELAVHAALTGHIMFSTLHTSNALGAIPRLTDMHVEPFLLASTLSSVIAQRLVRKICEFCKIDITLPEKLEQKIREVLKDVPEENRPEALKETTPLKFFKGSGCVRCNDSGYKGRTAIAEVVVVDDVMKDVISKGANLLQLEEAAKKQGMISMQQSGFLKALSGMTTVEEVLRVMQD